MLEWEKKEGIEEKLHETRRRLSGNETKASLYSAHHFNQIITILHTLIPTTHHFIKHIVLLNTPLYAIYHFNQHIT